MGWFSRVIERRILKAERAMAKLADPEMCRR